MEKEPPPPYSAATAYPAPQPGFNVPPNQVPPSQHLGYQPQPQQQGYSPAHGYPQAGYAPPPMQQGATTVVVTTVPVISQFGPNPQLLTCPHCRNQITSKLEVEAGMRTHLFALILCLFGCIPCCLIPYCMDSCQNRSHYCPSCGAFLGTYDEDAMARRRYW